MHDYFITEPLPCRPEEVQQYNSSHELTIQNTIKNVRKETDVERIKELAKKLN